MGRLSRLVFSISMEEVSFARRGFPVDEGGPQKRLEYVGRVFLHGYHSAIEESEPEALALRLHLVGCEWRGFAFEGAAMGLTLLDLLTPWKRNRLQRFLAGPGAEHVYMVHVGAGWALARLRRRIDRSLRRLDPLLGWLVADGYGFHEGYFHPRRTVDEQIVPGRLTGYSRRVFDQGLGRSLWFVNGADVDRIAATIAAFPESRYADLWSGVGLACCYAGGRDRGTLEALKMLAGLYLPQLAQGAAFAAKARQRAGNLADHTDLACQVLCDMPAEKAANLTDDTVVDLPFSGAEPAYEVWRQRTQSQFSVSALAS